MVIVRAMTNTRAFIKTGLASCFLVLVGGGCGPGPFSERNLPGDPSAVDAAAPTDDGGTAADSGQAAGDMAGDMAGAVMADMAAPAGDMSSPADMVVVPKCSAATCGGCCIGDVCQPGVTNSMCGAKGAACAVCPATAICLAGGTCGGDVSGSYVIEVEGRVSSRNSSGDCWDFPCSGPDPYLFVGASSTETEFDTYSPYWRRTFTVSYSSLISGVAFDMYDEDVSSDDYICGGTLRMTDADLRSHRAPTYSGSLCSVTFTVTKKP